MRSGIGGPAHWQRTTRLIESVRPNKKRHRVRAPLDAAHLHVNATARAVEGNLGGFCVVGTETVPARTTCRGRLCRNSGRVDHEEVSPTELVEPPLSGSKSTECVQLVFVRLAHDRRFVGAVLFLFL